MTIPSAPGPKSEPFGRTSRRLLSTPRLNYCAPSLPADEAPSPDSPREHEGVMPPGRAVASGTPPAPGVAAVEGLSSGANPGATPGATHPSSSVPLCLKRDTGLTWR